MISDLSMKRPTIILTILGWAVVPFKLLAQDPEPVAVSTVLPALSRAAGAYELPGRTEPLEQATIFTRATGIVSERKFDIGDQVQAGEVLAVIEVPEIDREVESAKAAVDQAESRAANARLIAERAEELIESKAISQEDSELRTSSSEMAEAALRLAKSELNRVGELQKFATVTAPFSGTVTARNFDRGDRMRGDSSTAEGWLYRLARLETLRFVIGATPDLAFRLSKENEAVVRFNELPGRTFVAQISRTSKVFDTVSGTMRVEFLIENKDLQLPAGLSGTAALKLPPMDGTFILPNNTFVIRQGKPLVAVVDAGKVVFLEVTPGRNHGATVEVTSSALTGETPVIINPNAMLKEGDRVKATAVVTGKAGK
jgi:RND family efflux transporter MFP subunit